MFFYYHIVCAILMVTASLVHETSGCGSTRKFFSDEDDDPRPNRICGKCGDPIQFTVIVKNAVLNPTFDFNITLLDQPQREMIHLLEKAAQMDKKFEFSVSYHNQFGYFLTSIGGQTSGLKGNYSYYWIMSDHPSGESLQLGLSSHIPAHQESVLFNLTRYGH